MQRINVKRLKALTDREARFLDNYLNPKYKGETVLAYVQAGFSDGPKAGGNARTKVRELREHIIERMHLQVGMHVPWALSEIIELAATTQNETIKLKCLQDILSRAGYDHPVVFESRENDPKDMTAKDIADELAKLLQKVKPDLKLVNKK